MSTNATLTNLKARLESERKDLCFEYAKDRIGIKLGHEAATARLMSVIEKAVEMATDIERGFEADVYGSEWQIDKDDMRQKAREFLNMINDEVRVK